MESRKLEKKDGRKLCEPTFLTAVVRLDTYSKQHHKNEKIENRIDKDRIKDLGKLRLHMVVWF